MQRVKLGSTGLGVSELCLGTMMFGGSCDEAEAVRIVDQALATGVDFIDTAASYVKGQTEEILGRALKTRRQSIFLATKTRLDTGRSITQSLELSLARLQTDWIDLYIIHWPMVGMNVPAIMAELAGLVKSGKVRHLGCSNYPAWLLAHSNLIAQQNGWPKLISNQVPYSIIERGIEIEVLPQAMAEDIAVTVYRPLVAGLLSGKYLPGEVIPAASRVGEKQNLAVWLEKYAKALTYFFEFAAAHRISAVELAIAWVRKSPAVTCPVVGISKLSQLDSLVKAFAFDLTDAEYSELNQVFDTAVKEEATGEYYKFRRELALVPAKAW
jgi:aryl-alcohol dehydrogenase-like predicted oxidoreductase